ncbi:hypothetical protein RHGRI_017276 [Rhododendron griersonianum]|uniref:Uncharacterized protein n=1 Tax=Rhododendron griersonianum TaxID=479676 RepID=A0AAV6JX88_9ERIC|nr:hypothetical protein RHGRI_017276 [Rhododendron griersonianum]
MDNTQFCYCRKVGKITCSWTDSNPGRRSKVVIPGLLRSLSKHEAVIKREKKKTIYLWLALTLSWVMWISGLVLFCKFK